MSNDCTWILVADSHRKLVPIHSNGHVVGYHENGALPLSVHWPHNGVEHGGNDVHRTHEATRTPSGDSGRRSFLYLTDKIDKAHSVH